MGGSLTSGSLLSSASSALSDFPPWSAPAVFFFAASARVDPAANASSSASASLLLVVLVLIGPVLTFERPVFLVVAHQPLDLKRREQIGREAALTEVLDLDL